MFLVFTEGMGQEHKHKPFAIPYDKIKMIKLEKSGNEDDDAIWIYDINDNRFEAIPAASYDLFMRKLEELKRNITTGQITDWDRME